jgi:predicted metal-dependent phosphoesterase TrpH
LSLDVLRWHRVTGARRSACRRARGRFRADRSRHLRRHRSRSRARSIRAVELSCDDGGRTIHVLAYDRGGDWAQLEDRLAAVRAARGNRLRVMAAKLAQRGIAIDIAPLVGEVERRSVGRPDLARLMVAAGHATSLTSVRLPRLSNAGPVDVLHRTCRSTRRSRSAAPPAPGSRSRTRTSRRAQRRACPPPSRARADRHEAFHGADARERARWTASPISSAWWHRRLDWHGLEAAQACPASICRPSAAALVERLALR